MRRVKRIHILSHGVSRISPEDRMMKKIFKRGIVLLIAAAMIALGIARKCNEKNFNRYVVCLDGDGASIMQMGNMAIAGAARQPIR